MLCMEKKGCKLAADLMQDGSHSRSATCERLLPLQANHMIEQSFEFVAEGDKYAALARLLEREMDGSRLLIFCETKRGCDGVTRQLRTEGWPALSIHGDKSQQERDWVLAVSAPCLPPENRPPILSQRQVAAGSTGPYSERSALCALLYLMVVSAYLASERLTKGVICLVRRSIPALS